jgi:protein O-mannosyl-transferase
MASGAIVLLFGLGITVLVYWPGLFGAWLFDDYPNIVDNPGVQPSHYSLAALVRAALSSPASDFKRPLASLSFALNYLANGLDPFSMKLTNLVIHLLNGVMIFFLSRLLISQAYRDSNERQYGIVAALIATCWLLLPINLTSVLYVVQRMESLANLFVLVGLTGYVLARRRMHIRGDWGGLAMCLASLVFPTALGTLTKETAMLLPLYACVIELLLFGFRSNAAGFDKRLLTLFALVLLLPATLGLAWLLPDLLKPEAWATRDFSLGTRLLSEARVVVDYIAWTLAPSPHSLSFYHDNFAPSSGLVSPWTTLTSILALIALTAAAIALRKQLPLVSLGILFFLSCHLLTATIIPLELVYEHRNYFASFGLMLAVVPLLASLPHALIQSNFLRLLGRVFLGGLLLLWATQTALSAVDWGDPLKLAQMLAERAPDSPRAQYELGRTYIIYSHYDPTSPYTKLAYAPLESAAALPKSSILPQQALIFMNARMGLPLKEEWWDSMIAKLASRPPGIQDESSLSSLVQCARDGLCDLPESRMLAAFEAALSHPNPSARLLAAYSDYAWNTVGNHGLGESLMQRAVKSAANEPAYRITLIRMLVANHQWEQIEPHMHALQRMNMGGRLEDSIQSLEQQINAAQPSSSSVYGR